MMPPAETDTTTLLSALKSAKINPEPDFSVALSPPTRPLAGVQIMVKNFDEMKEKIYSWLDNVGLKVNPFAVLDASRDPFIPFYLIEHNEYKSIDGDFTSFIFASPGSGKSAFRVRLARDCRVRRDGRKIFPIVYNLPSPDHIPISPDVHYRILARSAVLELMLYLVYHASSIMNDEALLSHFKRIFDLNLVVNYLQQMAESGNLQPLLDSFDPTARLLPNPPGRRDLVLLAARLNRIRYPVSTLRHIDYKQNFDYITSLIFEKLGYEAIYVLVDGVDGYVETGGNADTAVNAISWLLTKTDEWQRNRIFVKYFLPDDMKDPLERKFSILTSESKVTMIRWNADTLCEVVQQRLQEASGGKYNSLRALSSLPLRGAKLAPEEVLAHEIAKLDNPTPRELIQAVNRLLVHHVQYNEHEKLTPKDLQAAVDWIHLERSFKWRSA